MKKVEVQKEKTQEHSQLVRFYPEKRPDNKGRWLFQIMGWGHDRLEKIHDYIQWLFPLQERSEFNPAAPLLSANDIEVFRSNSRINKNLLCSFAVMLDFYGFILTMENGFLEIIKHKDFEEKAKNWITPRNHNFLRITRILKSLNLLGKSRFAKLFLINLENVYKDNQDTIGQKTLDYWRKAVS